MKTLLRVLALTVVVAFACLSSASANVYGFILGCYVSCPDGNYYIQASQCCGPIPRYEFTCPDGSDAYGYGYEDWNGPHFCQGI